MHVLEDEDIIALYFKRNESAIKETDLKYGRLCFNILSKLLDDQRDREECLNDVYMNLWNNIPPVHPTNLKAYIAKVVRNLSIKKFQYNKAAKRNRDLETSFAELENIIADNRYEVVISEEDLAKIVSDFLRTQKPDQRNVFIRKYWFFDSIEEIAERYHFSQTKVKSMLFHTREKLKKHLKKEGIRI